MKAILRIIVRYLPATLLHRMQVAIHQEQMRRSWLMLKILIVLAVIQFRNAPLQLRELPLPWLLDHGIRWV